MPMNTRQFPEHIQCEETPPAQLQRPYRGCTVRNPDHGNHSEVVELVIESLNYGLDNLSDDIASRLQEARLAAVARRRS
jgi:hypothetical protein